MVEGGTGVLVQDPAEEVRRVVSELRERRVQIGNSVRAAAAQARVAPSTVFRIESGQAEPTLLHTIALATAGEVWIDLDDGTDQPRRTPKDGFRFPPGYYRPLPFERAYDENWSEQKEWKVAVGELTRPRLGAELWWLMGAREPALTRPDVYRLLDLSPHALDAVLFEGHRWPDLLTVVRVAAVLGRRLRLIAFGAGYRQEPWIVSE